MIHAALLTGRAFAALPPERQETFAGVLREWLAERFVTCPLQALDADPMACPHRFASTFLAPVREYALATTGCSREAGGIDYFLPMAAAAYLRHVAVTDRDPEELLKPALALCAAVAIHPVTVANHFQMATASIPKVEPIIDRTVEREQEPPLPFPPSADPSRRLRDTRRSLIVSASLAAVLIVLGVQYLSTREPKAGGETATVRLQAPPQAAPKPVAPQPAPSPAPPSTPRAAVPLPEVRPLQESHPALKALSPKTRAYLRKVRDLSENSLAQVEVMQAAAARKNMEREELAETLDHGARQLQAWRQQFAALDPPRLLREQHHEVGRIMSELGRIAQTIRATPSKPAPGEVRGRLSAMHDELAHVLNDAEAF